jgi:hypothetical protein
MSSPFDALNYPFPIQLLRTTKGRMNQTTGAYVAPTATTLDLAGNYDPDPLEAEERQTGGRVEKGDARLYTEAAIKVGDRVRVHLDSSGSNYLTYLVTGARSNFGLMEALGLGRRFEYVLQKEDADRA